jgi:hypothetical protein
MSWGKAITDWAKNNTWDIVKAGAPVVIAGVAASEAKSGSKAAQNVIDTKSSQQDAATSAYTQALDNQAEQIAMMEEAYAAQFAMQEKYLELQGKMVDKMLVEGEIDRAEAYRLRGNLLSASQNLERKMMQAWDNLGPAYSTTPEALSGAYGMLRRQKQMEVDRAMDRVISRGYADNITRRPGMSTYQDQADQALLAEGLRQYQQADTDAYGEALSRMSSAQTLLNAHRDPYLNEVERMYNYPVKTAMSQLEVNIPRTGYETAANQFSNMRAGVPAYGTAAQNVFAGYGTVGQGYNNLATQYQNQISPYIDLQQDYGTAMGNLFADLTDTYIPALGNILNTPVVKNSGTKSIAGGIDWQTALGIA